MRNLLFIVILASVSCYAIPTDGLVGYWQADGNTMDASDLNNHGSLVNGASYGEGKFGQAFSFDGSNDYVQIGPGNGLRMSSELTISAWIKTSSEGIIVNKEGEYEVAVFSDNSLRWAFANSSPGWAWINTGFILPSNDWAHISVVFTTSSVKTYANGNLVDTHSTSGSLGDQNSSQNDFRIGGRTCCTQFFGGMIDEVAIHNRALAGEEILSLQQPDTNQNNAISSPVPEPATYLSLLLSCLLLIGFRQRKRA